MELMPGFLPPRRKLGYAPAVDPRADWDATTGVAEILNKPTAQFDALASAVGQTGGFPALPAALIKPLSTMPVANIVPTLTADGSFFTLPDSNTTGVFKKTAANGTTVNWTVTLANIDASCDKWTGMVWLDPVDEYLWCWAYDEGTAPWTYYLAKINTTTGAVTVVGTCQPAGTEFGSVLNTYHTERAAFGNGDFTISHGNKTIIISSTDGSIVTPYSTPDLQNGVIVDNTRKYRTLDGKIAVVSLYGTIVLQRGGGFGAMLASTDLSPLSNGFPHPWGDYLAMFEMGATTALTGKRFFNRAAFDLWLHAVCTYIGLAQ